MGVRSRSATVNAIQNTRTLGKASPSAGSSGMRGAGARGGKVDADADENGSASGDELAAALEKAQAASASADVGEDFVFEV